MVQFLKSWSAAVILAAALIAAAVPATLRSMLPTSTPQFVFRETAASSLDPVYSSDFLPSTGATSVHCATAAELANGDLMAAWYGGSDEAAHDVQIFTSTLDHKTRQWSTPAVLESRASVERSLHLHVKSIGNPVLIADSHGVSLFYAAILFGGWSGATICMKSSPDGVHWSLSHRVYTSPFLNIGMNVRGRPWRYSDGSIALPIYHELPRKWPAIARIDSSGRVIDEARISSSQALIQPWIVPTGPHTVVAFMRWSSSMAGCVTVTRSDDAGVHWSAIARTRLVHRDSAVCGTRLGDGSLLAVYNNSIWDRRDLSMARSADGGVHWSKPHPLERDSTPGNLVRREYSYPYVLQTRDGLYHLLYTWQRTRIRHVVFNDSWVLQDEKLGNPSS